MYVRILVVGTHERQFKVRKEAKEGGSVSQWASKRARSCQQYDKVAGGGSFNGQRRRGLVLNGLPTH